MIRWKITTRSAPGSSKGAAESALALYEDLAPPQPRAAEPDEAAVAVREPGEGRPTKRERRAIAHFRGEDEF